MEPGCLSNAASFTNCAMSPTNVMRNSKAMLTSQHESGFWSKRVRFIKPRVPPMPERGWPLLPTRDKDERQKRSRSSTVTREQNIAYFQLEGVTRELVRTT